MEIGPYTSPAIGGDKAEQLRQLSFRTASPTASSSTALSPTKADDASTTRNANIYHDHRDYQHQPTHHLSTRKAFTYHLDQRLHHQQCHSHRQRHDRDRAQRQNYEFDNHRSSCDRRWTCATCRPSSSTQRPQSETDYYKVCTSVSGTQLLTTCFACSRQPCCHATYNYEGRNLLHVAASAGH